MLSAVQKIAIPTLCGFVGGLLGFSCLQVSANADQISKSLQVHELRIIGPDGSTQINLQATNEGPAITLCDKNQKRRISLAILDKGSEPSSTLEFENLSSKTSQIVLTSPDANLSMLRMSDSHGVPWVHVAAGEYHAGGNHGQVLVGFPGHYIAELQASTKDARCELDSSIKHLKLKVNDAELLPQIIRKTKKSSVHAVFK